MTETTIPKFTGHPPLRAPLADQVFGSNKAPLADVLAADYADLKAEVDAFVAKMREAAKAKPGSDADNAALGQIILDGRSLWNRAEAFRTDDKAPILSAGRELDAWFKDMLSALVAGGTHLQGMADTYAREKAAAERARLQREADEARAKAEAERQKAEAAKTAAGAAKAEGRAEAHDAKADAAAAAAGAADADLVRARVGGVTASAKGSWVAAITDYQEAIKPLGALGAFLKRDAIEAGLNSMAKVQQAGAAWPGVNFYQDTKATFRR